MCLPPAVRGLNKGTTNRNETVGKVIKCWGHSLRAVVKKLAKQGTRENILWRFETIRPVNEDAVRYPVFIFVCNLTLSPDFAEPSSSWGHESWWRF